LLTFSGYIQVFELLNILIHFTISFYFFCYNLIRRDINILLKKATMRKKNFIYLLSFTAGLFILISGCSKSTNSTGSLYVPTSADATATASLADLQQGRTLYVNNCGNCHSLYSPDSYNSTQWKSIISSMSPRTSMSSSEILLVTKYVTRGK
jgi:hypothetical protein